MGQLFGLSTNSSISRERDRSPRRDNGARRYDDRSRRERDWGNNLSARSSTYGRSARLEPGVYVVDIKKVFATYHASFTDTAGVRRMAKNAGLVQDHQWYGAGREAGLLIELWSLFVSGPSTGLPKKVRDAAWERQRAALLGGGSSTGASDERPGEAQAVANGDDSDDDLNAGPSVVLSTPAAGGGDPYLNDYSDRGDSDDDDD
ncbi:uncharacterized protein SCHCODRAFT_02668954 [Schizophyllum commune H4-8]|uniref:Expressed protein n=1 Tax=Schizophyllum commune (strain H4-8 / FGSC 9210) TaxID=578458 RepID=D8Q753_SCHCM|nr:uncharacterized protein SCHCODRAFT_02668954 [Schizophyllum commune H4-8]KAI5891637.1 hypothetical protein SCHCODRAFT_02668954 [Schizophyllum commune H4-8]